MFQPCDDQITVHCRADMPCRDKQIVTPPICGRNKTVPVTMQAESAYNQVDLFRQGEASPFQLHEGALFHQIFQSFPESLTFAGAQVQCFLNLPEAQGTAGVLLQQVQDITESKITHIV